MLKARFAEEKGNEPVTKDGRGADRSLLKQIIEALATNDEEDEDEEEEVEIKEENGTAEDLTASRIDNEIKAIEAEMKEMREDSTP
eukprot:Skav230242  [mRNA]  locus=scaffold1818:123563:124833:- [translate_table: standard]